MTRAKLWLAVFIVAGCAANVPAAIPSPLTAFGVTPAIPTGGHLLVYFVNGKVGQAAALTLLSPGGEVLATIENDNLGPAGGPNSTLLLTWTNPGSAMALTTIQLDVSQYFNDGSTNTVHGHATVGHANPSDESNGTVLLMVTGTDADFHTSFASDGRSFLSPAIGTGAGPTTSPLTVFAFQNYPNPFKSSQGTHFLYNIGGVGSHHGASNDSVSNISIRIWSTAGYLVKTITKSTTAARGVIEWDGKNDAGAQIGTGIYLAEILVNSGDVIAMRLRMAAIGGD